MRARRAPPQLALIPTALAIAVSVVGVVGLGAPAAGDPPAPSRPTAIAGERAAGAASDNAIVGERAGGGASDDTPAPPAPTSPAPTSPVPTFPARAASSGPPPWRRWPLRLDATRLEVDARKLVAEGEVQLGLGSCVLHALALHLDDVGGLAAEHVSRLRAGRLRFSATRLTLDANGGLTARWPRGTLCGCAPSPEAGSAGSTDDERGARRPLLEVGARAAHITAGGRRLHLDRPSLWIARRRVLTLPWIALPLAPGTSGLLLPEVGYSGRDGARLEQAGYLAQQLADVLLGAGWIQHRGATGRARLRYFTAEHGDGALQLVGLIDGDRPRGLLRGQAALRWRWLAAGVAPDLASDQTLAATIERANDRVFAPYARSRLWASAGWGAAYLVGEADALQELRAPLATARGLQGRLRATAGLHPLRLLGPLALAADATLEHWPGAASPLPLPTGGPPGGEATPLAELSVAPRLVAATALGPFAFSAQAAYRYHALWTARRRAADEPATISRHAGLLALEAALPLGRSYRAGAWRVQHRIEPFAGVLYAPAGSATVAQGAFLPLGLRMGLLARDARGALRRLGRSEARIDVPLSWPAGELHSGLLAGGELLLGAESGTHARGRWRWRPSQRELVELQAEGCLRWGLLSTCAGYTRLRLARADDPFGGGAASWVAGVESWRLLRLDAALDQVAGALRLELGPVIVAARVAVDPEQGRLTEATGRLTWTIGCGCYRFELEVQGRPEQRWPDVLGRVTLLAPGLPTCTPAE